MKIALFYQRGLSSPVSILKSFKSLLPQIVSIISMIKPMALDLMFVFVIFALSGLRWLKSAIIQD